MFRLAAAGAALSLLLTASAAAQDLRPVTENMTAADIERVLKEAGLNPTMTEDAATGAPVATGNADGVIFVLRAVDCAGTPQRCQQLVLFANFELRRDITERDFRVVNGFNDSAANGRAYVLEGAGQVGVDYVIDLTGGVTAEHIQGRLGKWPEIIGTFREQMVGAYTGV
ncbi:YbjN domain-containing protein [Parvularcula maris]|uniref:YbjN domain-containing protein n=1 Tax=Parvularcula maris TaxID=2965077 RepID=A0A9X2L6G0_9PROT|nr:YbjN domain-containing protein [Parvularcula maris]MCQ8183927.1 YbjN domain-containing protein [Parvularcula maris]